MNKNEELERFTQDVDSVIHNLSPESQHWTEAYRGEMEVVQALAMVDFSEESRVRHTLKRELLNSHIDNKERIMKASFFQRSFVRVSIGISIVILILAVSPLGSSLAQSVVQIVRQWQVGDNTKAVSVEGDFEALPDENGETLILPAPQSSDAEEASAPSQETGMDQQRQLVLEPSLSIEQAQEMVQFTLREPAFVPDGYEFQGVVVIDSGQASLEYVNASESRLMGLLQTAVGGADGQVQLSFSSDMDTQEVIVNGQDGLWVQAGDEGLLMWEAQSVNYQLIGQSELEVALRVAESIE